MKVAVSYDPRDINYVFVIVVYPISIDFVANVDTWFTSLNNDQNEVIVHNGWRLHQQTFTMMQLKWNLEIIEG